MEKASTTVADETQTLPDVKSIPIQTNCKRRELYVTDNTSEESLPAECSAEICKNVQDEIQSSRHGSVDVVDCIGDKHDQVKGRDYMTKVDSIVDGSERPTTLDMNPTVSAEWNQRAQISTRSEMPSTEVTDSTPCTPPEPRNLSENSPR
jgi:hypothetical protein